MFFLLVCCLSWFDVCKGFWTFLVIIASNLYSVPFFLSSPALPTISMFYLLVLPQNSWMFSYSYFISLFILLPFQLGSYYSPNLSYLILSSTISSQVNNSIHSSFLFLFFKKEISHISFWSFEISSLFYLSVVAYCLFSFIFLLMY